MLIKVMIYGGPQTDCLPDFLKSLLLYLPGEMRVFASLPMFIEESVLKRKHNSCMNFKSLPFPALHAMPMAPDVLITKLSKTESSLIVFLQGLLAQNSCVYIGCCGA
jgi:hypothetical protein